MTLVSKPFKTGDNVRMWDFWRLLWMDAVILRMYPKSYEDTAYCLIRLNEDESERFVFNMDEILQHA